MTTKLSRKEAIRNQIKKTQLKYDRVDIWAKERKEKYAKKISALKKEAASI